ncbi:glycosyltransferase [Fulvivirga maritima]|uniref:glycosyltransferase n=1 Tax=Fulvivirga maritima TaxID=2904247 RepID=UPI001F36AF77|nr:glycosyltransferase [Fulvivirga maritima]UII24845.1 glycosyltransferase [Fulvivirga maritima]
MKIKVLHVIKSLGRGGAEMLLPETLALHNKNQFEFHYIYFLPWKDQMVESIEREGGAITCFNASNNIKLIAKRSELVQYVKQNGIQLIHAHLPWAGFLSRLVNKLNGIPVIYTEHNKQERYHKITFALNKITFPWQNKVLAVSGDVHESILKNIGERTKIETLLNGVNTDKFKRLPIEVQKSFRQEHGIPESALVVGTVAVFRFQKRLKEWMEVFSEAAKSNPNLYGVIVGDGPLKDELLEERKRLGLEDRILMPGLQINTRDWFSIMDIFMMTSVFEGLPIALLEAMSMECAVLTTDAGGIKEVIEADESGVMVSVDNWSQLSNSLKDINTSQIEKLGKNARQRVIDHFSLNNMVSRLEQIYKEESNGN